MFNYLCRIREISVVHLDDLISLQEQPRGLGHPPRDQGGDEDPRAVPPAHQTQAESLACLPCQGHRQVLVLRALGPPVKPHRNLVLSSPQLLQGLTVGQLSEVHRVDLSNPITRQQFLTFLPWPSSVDLMDEDPNLQQW